MNKLEKRNKLKSIKISLIEQYSIELTHPFNWEDLLANQQKISDHFVPPKSVLVYFFWEI